MTTEEFDFTDRADLRRKAEEKLREKQTSPGQSMHEADLQKLLHELQVHQIELEMQNEELKMAYETTESTLKKYTMLYDLAPIGFFILEGDGSISDLNFTGADFLEDKRFNLIGSNFKLFIAEASRHVFNEFFSKVYASNAKRACEIALGYNGRILRSVYMEGVVTGDNGTCLVSVVDVSALKKVT